MTIENRRQFLQTVDGLVNGDRNVQYGEPIHDFKCTAMMLSAFLGIPIQPWQVPMIQVIVKLSRLRTSPTKDDHYLDIDGYGVTGFDVKDYVIEYPEGFFDAEVADRNSEPLRILASMSSPPPPREGDQQV